MSETRQPPKHAPQSHYPVEGNELLIGGIPASRLAARVGQTPFYAYDRSVLGRRVQELRTALPQALSLHYAMKANPMPALVGHMAGLVDGLDVASGRELRVALDSGMNPQHISFAGPGKSEVELTQAVATGVLLNVESFREARELARIGERSGWTPRVAVRVNPDFELKSSGMKMGGGPKQFGVDAEQVPALLAEIGQLGLGFEGFHLYAGSQNLKAESIVEAQQKSFELALRLAADAPRAVTTLNLGGGFGIPYFPGETPLQLAPIGDNLATILDRAATALPGAEIVIELGRYLVGEAGVYVCRVVDKKVSRGHTYLVVDGGLHHHLAASGNFGQVIRKNYPVAIATRMDSTATEQASVVGPLCTPLDLLGERMELATAEPGDLVAVFQSGAYGYTASPRDFLSQPQPVEVLV
ncbi:pyridoxal-dependent decarboxylase, exosortase A system-associated [Uliginosibacterium sp. H1]|uniref:pyridoxal-dependent decarboxylase, exosortase A system-associated n=1 Tax=Uliginosibacterium sp. H1 TaxID=3114757 RepID=UPI002E178C11|nr:pyridoxal-dependent decarboxylase, exosortase A system-associated [Uliginosibacterium sp. H1]